jgi:hypothetical protein
MESESELEELRERFKRLLRLTEEQGPFFENGKDTNYVYVTDSEEVDPLIREIYLPQIIGYLLGAALDPDNLEYTTFAGIWGEFRDRGYYRITDSEPLSILDVATVWIGMALAIKLLSRSRSISRRKNTRSSHSCIV